MSFHSKRLHLASIIASAGIVLATIGLGQGEELKGKEIATVGAAPAKDGRFDAVDVDQLTANSDFTIFMRPDCPPELQQKALQRLWKLLPAETVVDNSPI